MTKPDGRDFHIYGGLLVVGAALVASFGWAGAAVPGAFLVYLGIWRLG